MSIIFRKIGNVLRTVVDVVKDIPNVITQRARTFRSRDLTLDDVSVGVIFALPKELAAARAVFNCANDAVVRFGQGGQRYFIAIVDSRYDGKQIVALHMLDRAGNSVSAAQAIQMTQDCARMKYLIMCGIAGAVPNLMKADDHVRLGDIVYSDDVMQHDFGTAYSAGLTEKPRFFNAHPRLIEAARHLDDEILSGQKPWERYIESAISVLGQEYQRPFAETDVLLDSDISECDSNALSSAKHPSDPRRADARAEKPVVFRGRIASADHVLKHPAKRDDLREKYGAKAVEMEGHGIGYASWHSERGFIVVRGACDYCNMSKGDGWQNYAAVAAAGYARALIENLRVEHILPGPRESTRHFQISAAPQPMVKMSGTIHGVTAPTPTPATPPVSEADSLAIAVDQMQKFASTNAEVEQVNVAGLSQLERQLLTSEGERRFGEIKALLDVWEFESAVAMTESLAEWVELHERHLSQDLRVQLYSQLARLEAVRASRQKDRGEAHDSKRARIYLEKAKDAANR